MRVLFVSKNRAGPTARYRVLPLIRKLRSEGVETEHMDEFTVIAKLGLLRRANEFDLVFVQRRLLAGWLLAAIRKPLVFDFDDAIFCRSNGEESRRRLKRFRRMVARADLVLAGSRYLAERCEGKDAVVVPTAIDAERCVAGPKTGGDLVLAWVGSRSTGRYLEGHRRELEQIGDAFPGIRLKVVADFEFNLSNITVDNIPWSTEAEVSTLAEADIGIAPLPDNPWTQGKCAFKVLQYMAASLPVIASPVGANRDVVVDGKTGILANSAQQWCRAVERLGDRDLREQMGAAGRRRVETDYAESVMVKRVLGTLRGRGLL
jgi:glycosyltransferase involved in cell wall biosynthesis